MPDRDIDTLNDVVEQRCDEVEDEAEVRRAHDALDRIQERLALADELHDSLSTRYTLVWPIPGILISGRRRKRLVRDYGRLRAEARREPRHPH
ncbi:MAG: hypothetical protein IBX62_00840 [Coriobacteriia bacterium]|nr:hypothetical protein [Coriobacteriia bacterium]